MVIDEIDRQNLNHIKKRLQQKVDELAAEFDMGIFIGRIRFDSQSADIKLEFAVKDVAGTVQSKMTRDFLNAAEGWGLNKDDLGKTFKFCSGRNNYNTFRILGAKLKNWKHPIIAENISNGKRYKFSPRDVVTSLASTPIV